MQPASLPVVSKATFSPTFFSENCQAYGLQVHPGCALGTSHTQGTALLSPKGRKGGDQRSDLIPGITGLTPDKCVPNSRHDATPGHSSLALNCSSEPWSEGGILRSALNVDTWPEVMLDYSDLGYDSSIWNLHPWIRMAQSHSLYIHRATGVILVVQQVKPLLTRLASHIYILECLLFCKGNRKWIKCLGSCHSRGRPGWSSKLLTSMWPNLRLCSQLGSKPAYEGSLSLSIFPSSVCHSAYQIKKQIYTNQTWCLEIQIELIHMWTAIGAFILLFF